MRNKMLASAVFAAALALPLVAHAQDGAGPTNWANAGGTDPARNLVGFGIRIFNHGQAYGPNSATYPSSHYSSLALYESRTPVATKRKKK
jgi:hypothetical protein